MTFSQHPLDNKLLLGRYRVIRLLGEGGMGTVHLARVEGAEGFTRPVVVKRMKRDMRATEEGNRLFIREAKILSKLQHPSIVGISDFGVEDGAHIMVLEYVHGYTLSAWLDFRFERKLPLPVDICLFIIRRTLDALHYAHHFGTGSGKEIQIVHRDISPDNVLISNNAHVHLLDFGIASMRGAQGLGTTQSVGFRGKLCYAAPETVQGDLATPRSDQYSAAVLLLELLTGEVPFQSDSVGETFRRMVEETPPLASESRDDISPQLDQVLARALEKDPLRRFDSALAFSRELKRVQSLDDEDVAEQLLDTVRMDFELLPAATGVEGLKERAAALEKALSIIPGPPKPKGTHPPHGLPTMMDTNSARSTTRNTPVAGNGEAPAPQQAQKQLHGLLWGLLVVGGLIAVGLGAAVALLSRNSPATEQQVVVVGGDRDPTSNATDPGPSPNTQASTQEVGGSAPQLSIPSTGPTLDPPKAAHEEDAARTAFGTESQSGSAATGPVTAAKQSSRSVQQELSRAVQQRSSAFQACFAKHIDNTKNSPKAVIHFSVARAGGGAQVKIEPNTLAVTPLGACLKRAAGQVQFPQLAKPVAFRVPVSARVSRSKGNL